MEDARADRETSAKFEGGNKINELSLIRRSEKVE